MKVSIVYDGFCPVCSRLVAASRLRERASKLELLDARTQPVDDVQGLDLSELDFDQGFAVVTDGEVHFGADGARVLAVLTEPSALFYRMFQLLVRTAPRSRFWYPVFKAGRRVLLFVMRVPRFETDRQG